MKKNGTGIELETPWNVQEGLRTLVRGRIDEALALLAGGEAPLDARVHEARKIIKELRAVVRLVRRALAPAVYRSGNVRLRDAGRSLASLRDLRVQWDLASKLTTEAVSEGEQAVWEALGEETEERRVAYEAAAAQGGNEGEAPADLERAARKLLKLRNEVGHWTLGREGFKVFEAGLKEAYRESRDGWRRGVAAMDGEGVHTWRKRVKDLRYQMKVLRRVWPEWIDGVEASLHRLTDLLGDHQDLEVMRERIARGEEGAMGAEGRKSVEEMLSAKQRKLRERSMPLAQRLFAEKPRDFVKRVESYWEGWQLSG